MQQDFDELQDDSQEPAIGLLAQPQAIPDAAPTDINPIIKQYLMNKQAMGDAQNASNQNQLYAGLARAGGTLASAIAGSSKPINEAGYNALDAAANAPVQNIVTQQGSDLKDLQNQQALRDVQKKAELDDPDSDQSTAMQNMIAKLYPGKFSKEDLDNLRASDADLIFKPLELNEKVEANRIQRQQAYQTKLQEKDSKNLIDAQNQLDKLDQYKKAKEGLDAANEASDLIDSARTNPTAAQALPTVLARVSTHGQRVNQAEMGQFGGSQAVMDKIAQFTQKATQGTLTPENYQEMKSIVDVYKNANLRTVNDVELTKAKQLSQANGKSVEENYTRLTGGKTLQQKQSSPSTQSAGQSQYKAGDVVMIKGQKYVVGADGNSLSPAS